MFLSRFTQFSSFLSRKSCIFIPMMSSSTAVDVIEDKIYSGVVKWFNTNKGYGFITDDSGNDYFVHYSNIYSKGFRSLQNLEQVEFKLKKDEKNRYSAFDVTGPDGNFVKGVKFRSQASFDNPLWDENSNDMSSRPFSHRRRYNYDNKDEQMELQSNEDNKKQFGFSDNDEDMDMDDIIDDEKEN